MKLVEVYAAAEKANPWSGNTWLRLAAIARPLLVLTLGERHPYDQVVQGVNQIGKE